MKNYIVGLDIGTNSCGWVATDFENNILKLHGKTAIGARLFEEGQTAEERRSFRTTRRRLARRKWRLKLLEEIFDPEMAKLDPTFFARLKDAGLSPKDARKKQVTTIWQDRKTEKEFYDQYPTIYHLRKALMEDDQQHDLREVYLAIHHIVKYRGNFLHNEAVNRFDASKIDVAGKLRQLNELLKSIFFDEAIQLNETNAAAIEAIIKDESKYKKDQVKEVGQLLLATNSTSLVKTLIKQVTNAILGYKFRVDKLFELSDVDTKAYGIKFSDLDADDKVQTVCANLTTDQVELLNVLQSWYSAIVLCEIVPEGLSLSDAMIQKYRDHKKDLRLLRQYLQQLTDPAKKQKLSDIYNSYIGNRKIAVKALKERADKWNKKIDLARFDDLKKVVSSCLDDSDLAQQIQARLDKGEFLPKQRTKDNGVIPYQLHEIELNRILEKQGKYYPFLVETNPVTQNIKRAPYKISQLMSFRVPYYVGPMVDPKQVGANEAKFAWMTRRQNGRITPWNFDEMVDRTASANTFITRMTTKDTYLLGEDVLPAASLLYQKFEVLNELNIVSVNHRKLPSDLKRNAFESLFKQSKTVSKKKFITFLEQHGYLNPQVSGMADESKFNSSLSTYLDYHAILGDAIDDTNKRHDIERIIKWSTIFEDRAIFQQKLEEITWLTPTQRHSLVRLRYQGWGRLSAKLLQHLPDSNGVNILNRLWNEQDNLQRILADPTIKAGIIKANEGMLDNQSMEDVLDETYTSPQNKKAIRQVMRVVYDLVKAAKGQVPSQIAIEFARSPEKKPQRTDPRIKRMQDTYKAIKGEVLSAVVKEQLNQQAAGLKNLSDRLYLYFSQAGRDAYTGKPLDLDRLSTYDIDHIFPQAYVIDDSLDNRVLVSSKLNREKSDDVPFRLYGNNPAQGYPGTIKEMWATWQKANLISKRKYNNLVTDTEHLTKWQQTGFVQRQLVETSQVIKLVATILQHEFPDTQIIEVKAAYNSMLRKEFNLYKSREVNDYHHAIDAYLSTIVGNYLYQVYPRLHNYFVYGAYKHFSKQDEATTADAVKATKQFNFIWQLLYGPDDAIKVSNNHDLTVFSRHDIIQKLQRAYAFKLMHVTQAVSTRSGAMFNQTVYPIKERDNTKTRTLIPRGKNLPVEIYGGYSGNADAYMALVKVEKKAGAEYRIIGVPVRSLTILKQASDSKQALHQVLTPLVMNDKKGKPKRGVLSFRVLLEKVPYKQPIIDGDRKFMLGSAAYIYPTSQMVLDSKSMQYILDYIDDPNGSKHHLENHDEDEARALLYVYDQILANIDKYLAIFDINKFRANLHVGREQFQLLSLDNQVVVLKKVLEGLHPNASVSDLKNIKISVPLGKMQYKQGVPLSSDALIVYQSPTGLFERRVKVSDL